VTRTLLVCPGRGSYTSSTQGWVTRHGSYAQDLIAAADARRASRGEEALSDLDQADRFDARKMLVGANAAGLTFLSTACDLRRLREEVEPVAVIGNSMGWYSALYAAGALAFEDALEVVETMGGMQGLGSGSQLLYPLVDEQWRASDAARHAVEQALVETGCRWSIRLGGIAVLAGESEAIEALERALPTAQLGRTSYPYRLTFHAAYHTPLMRAASERGFELLSDRAWASPSVSLVDGAGRVHRPGIASPREILDYTLGCQVTDTFDFTGCLEVALRSFAPEQIVLLGPGSSLGGAVAQILIGLRWRGIESRADFDAMQRSESPLIISLDRADQAALVVRSESTS